MVIDKNEEKRRFHRILFNAEAILQGEEAQYSCKILDLSLKGCLLEFNQTWLGKPNQLYTLTFKLTDEISIDMKLAVMHCKDSHCGFECQYIDIDSISSLRRLVELNIGDSELLERELVALCSIGMDAT
jgi:hypothetical protein